MNTLANPYITTLGIIDFVLDSVGASTNRLEIRDQLLSAIMSGFNSKLLDQPQIARKMQEVSVQLGEQDSFQASLQKIATGLDQTDLSGIDLNQFLIDETKSVLTDFVSKSKPKDNAEVLETIQLVLV